MARALDPELPVGPDLNLTANEILDIHQEIVSSALALTTVLNARFAQTEPSGLAPFALRAIHAAGRRGLSQIDLARSLHRSAPSTTRLLDFLEHLQLVERTPHPSDRRINMIHLSDAGQTMLDDILEDARLLGFHLFPPESETSKNDFRSQLSRIILISQETRPE